MPIPTPSDEQFEKSAFAIPNESLENQCKKRGIRMAFLTLAPGLGLHSLPLIKELHAIMTQPMIDELNHVHDLENELFLRMTYWANQAQNNVFLFNESEQAFIERCADFTLGNHAPLSQERFEQLWQTVLESDLDSNVHTHAHLN